MAKQQFETINISLPTGRIVQGAPDYWSDKDPNGNEKKNPGWFFAVAVPKSDPVVGNIINEIVNLAMRSYQAQPQIQQTIAQGPNGPFSFKVRDGDNPKYQGKEGFAGCWIFAFSSQFAIRCGVRAPNGTVQECPPGAIKCGYFVDVEFQAVINGLITNQAGIFLNPRGVILVGYAQEIVSGPTLDQLYQGRQPTRRDGMLDAPPPQQNWQGGQPAQQQPAQWQGQPQGGQPMQGQQQPAQWQGQPAQSQQPMQGQQQPAQWQGQPAQQQPAQWQGQQGQPQVGQPMQQQAGNTWQPPQVGQPMQPNPTNANVAAATGANPVVGATGGYQGIAFPSN